MYILISDEHIEELVKANNYRIDDLNQLRSFIEEKMMSEDKENGATYLCVFIEHMLNLAF